MSDWHGGLVRVTSEQVVACTSGPVIVTFSKFGGARFKAFISRDKKIFIGGPAGTLRIRLTPLGFIPIREYFACKIHSTFLLALLKATRNIAIAKISFFAFFGLTQCISGSIFQKPEVT